MKKYLIIFILVAVLANMQKVYASHAAGSDLTYRCLGGNTYLIEVTFYRDCGGVVEPISIPVKYKSISCGYDFTVSAGKIAVTGQEITTPCQSAVSTCNGGSTTGIRKFVYQATVNLPAACSDWVFSYEVCCRNCSITTIQNPCANSSRIYVEATLNNVSVPENSSPSFSNSPIVFSCVGQLFNYNPGVIDADGDSLVYELITPMISATATVVFNNPLTTTSPLASSTAFFLDPLNGQITFTPSQTQIGIMAIRVKEFRNNQLVGSVIRDMQVYTVICNNNLPSVSGINNSNTYSATAHPGQELCFDIFSSDNDSLQTTVISHNSGIPDATYTITGGATSSLEFCWTPALSDVSPLPYTFTVMVRDNACPTNGVQIFSYDIYVTNPQFTAIASGVSCNGGSNGSIILNIPNGNSYTYLWSNGATTQNLYNLISGNYSVIITGANGATWTISETILQPEAISALVSSIANSACTNSNGAINLFVSGGVEPYGFSWSNGSTTQDLSNLLPGNYTVVISDNNGCSATVASTVLQNSPSISSAITVTQQVSCYGGNNGMVDLAVSGGATPYSYLWSNGSSAANLENVEAGKYNVVITDVNGCTVSDSVAIRQPLMSLDAFIDNLSHVNCFAGSNGIISVTAAGGTTPLHYSWSNGNTSQAILNIPAGNYSVVVTDANGCTDTQAATIMQPSSALTSSPDEIQSVKCFNGDDGAIDLGVSGGTEPYFFYWSNQATTEDISNLIAGIYTVTITDANGCTGSQTATVIQPSSALTSSLSVLQQVKCFNGNNGAIEMVMSGGTEPYSFIWNNQATTEDLDSLIAGTYTVQITDANGCTGTQAGTVVQPASALMPSLNVLQNVKCFNGNDGAIDLEVSGGTEPYSFKWNNEAITEDIDNLIAGTYTTTVTDANECTSIFNAEITQPQNALALTINTIFQTGCSGAGNIDLSIEFGTPPYSYYWNNGNTTQDITSVPPGSYTVTVTDANGCTTTSSVILSQSPSNLSVSGNVTNSSCIQQVGGSININYNGGIAPYTYSWSNGLTTQNISGLSQGNYVVVVNDANGCSGTASFTISDHFELKINASGPTEICNGKQVILQTDSIAGATYQWYYNNEVLTGSVYHNYLAPSEGIYNVVLTHACGVFSSDSIPVRVIDLPELILSPSVMLCPGENTQLVASGGTDYLWTPATGLDFNNVPDPIASPEQTTNYTVEISGDSGCKTSGDVLVSVICDSLIIPSGFSPNSDGVNDGFVIKGIDNYPGNSIWIYNRWGALVYKAKDYGNKWDGISNISGSQHNQRLQNGTFFYILDLNNGEKPLSGYIILKK